MLELSERQEQGWSVLVVNGRLDSTTVEEFSAKCATWINASQTNVVLDLSGLQYISSGGLSSILGAAKRVQARNGRLAVTGLKGLVKEVFAITGFETVLPTFPDVETAIKTS